MNIILLTKKEWTKNELEKWANRSYTRRESIKRIFLLRMKSFDWGCCSTVKQQASGLVINLVRTWNSKQMLHIHFLEGMVQTRFEFLIAKYQWRSKRKKVKPLRDEKKNLNEKKLNELYRTKNHTIEHEWCVPANWLSSFQSSFYEELKSIGIYFCVVWPDRLTNWLHGGKKESKIGYNELYFQ